MNGQSNTSGSCNTPQMMADQRPKFDNAVHSRKYKIMRPRKPRKKPKFM
jgi:hypothetical protein